MAHRHPMSEDAATWRSQYERLRDIYGSANVYAHNIRSLVLRAAQHDWLSEGQRNELNEVLAEIDADLRRASQNRMPFTGT